MLGKILFYGGIFVATVFLVQIVKIVRFHLVGTRMMREDPKAFAEAAADFRESASKIDSGRENATECTSEPKATPTEHDIRDNNFGKHFYLMDYRQHYSKFLDGSIDQKRTLSELFLFRGWTTQFGFRIFNSQEHLTDEILNNIVNSATTLGVGIFNVTHGFDPQEILGKKLIDLIENRWQAYDAIVEGSSGSSQIPTAALVGAAMRRSDIHDPSKFVLLSSDFMKHLMQIKDDAIDLGLF